MQAPLLGLAGSLDSSFFTSFKRKWTSITFWTTLGVFFCHFGFGLMGTLDPLWWPFVIVCDALSNNLTTIQLSWWRVEVHSPNPNHPSESLQDWRVEELFYNCYSLQRWFPSEGVCVTPSAAGGFLSPFSNWRKNLTSVGVELSQQTWSGRNQQQVGLIRSWLGNQTWNGTPNSPPMTTNETGEPVMFTCCVTNRGLTPALTQVLEWHEVQRRRVRPFLCGPGPTARPSFCWCRALAKDLIRPRPAAGGAD